MDTTLQTLLSKFLLMPLEVPTEGLSILRAVGSQQER